MWVLWKTRNDMVFNNRIATTPVVVVHRMVAFLTEWKPLADKDLEKVEEVIGKLTKAYSGLA
uniref:Uncharacterized protein n=1 Tax=Setaria viridis TaxID=4556 RepID=A0A4U6UKA6_SETVI|nr:hypothetical protein SEVIR_5G321466v2 [Setaria viridis]